MRALVLLAALLLLPAASAQMDFTNDHQVRVGFGDIPSTDGTESPGAWNFEETFMVAEGESTIWTLPDGHELTASGCKECTSSTDGSNAPEYNFTCVTAASGTCAVTAVHSVGGSEATTFASTFELRADSMVVVYAPTGTFVNAPLQPTNTLACTDPSDGCTIYQFQTAGRGSFWFTVSPTGPATTAVAPGGFGVMELIVGLLAGGAIWYVLVRGGFVQKRQRKQIAGTSAHKEVAKAEDKPTLIARKRALMAALKELEIAKMNKEIDTAAYDVIKAEFKKNTVTVMRAIEESN